MKVNVSKCKLIFILNVLITNGSETSVTSCGRAFGHPLYLQPVAIEEEEAWSPPRFQKISLHNSLSLGSVLN